mgnify:CR=1 FL=1
MAREDVNIKVSANVAEAIQLWKAMEAGPEGMAKSLDAMGQKGKKSADLAGDSILAMATKFGSASAIIATVVAGLKKIEDQAQAAANRVFNTLGSFGELQQVSNNPQEFARNVARARGLVAKGIVPPDQAGQAADMVFAMVSAGYTEEEKDFITKLGERKFVKPEGLLGLAESLQKYRRVFGEKDAGNLQSVTDKVIQAAGTAQATVPETLKGVLEVAPSATLLGMSDEETVAGLLAVEALSPNMEMASTKYRSFLDQVNKQGLWKGSTQATVAGLRDSIRGGGNAFDLLGESRAVQAFENLSKSTDFMAQQQDLLATAPNRKLFESQSGLLETDPLLRSAKRKAESEGALAITEEATTDKELLFDAYWAEQKKRNIRNNGQFFGGIRNLFEDVGMSIIDTLQLEREEFGRMPTDVFNDLPPSLRRDIAQYNRQYGSLLPTPKAKHDAITAPGPAEIRIVGPDGLDIPTEPAVQGLNDSPEAVQRMMNWAR